MQTPNSDYDLSTLYEIADGNNEFIVDTITLFISQTGEFFNDLGNAIEIGEWSRVATTAHKLKSNLGFFGMHNAEALTQQIEYNARNEENTAQIAEDFLTLHTGVSAAIDKLYQLKLEKESEL
jgi:HPt (histidine-containing phosphotransfer) domain-containing protein